MIIDRSLVYSDYSHLSYPSEIKLIPLFVSFLSQVGYLSLSNIASAPVSTPSQSAPPKVAGT